MIDHTGITVSDWKKSKAFFDAAVSRQGVRRLRMMPALFTGERVTTWEVKR